MSAELSFSSSPSLSLEDLKQNPLIQQFASVDSKTAALSPSVKFFSDLCKSICGGEQA